MWGLPQAGILANKCPQRKLVPFRYSECVNTLRLWRHETQPISFTLVVDDFGVKYVSKEDVNHLTESIKSTNMLTKNWTGKLYCGITLEWDDVNTHVDISMPNYLKKKLQEYGHIILTCLHSCLYQPEPKKIGTEAQTPSCPTLPLPLMRWGLKEFKRSLAASST